MFPPDINTHLSIHGRTFVVAEHPSIHGMPYGQEGRQGTVYKLMDVDGGGAMALKVFRPAFRHPSIVRLCEQISSFSEMKGLLVSRREVLSPQHDLELLTEYPELLYAVLMPWIDGTTWSDVLLEKSIFTAEQCKEMALTVISTLAAMEQHGIAHTDLYAPNLIITDLSVELIDIEGMYASGLDEPENLPEGITGYTPLFMRDYPDWSKYSDRFSGAIIISEILAWVSEEIRESAWGESFFDPEEMQQEMERYFLMHRTLESYYGHEIAGLFARAWATEQLQQCPTFGEWMVCLSSVQVSAIPETDVAESTVDEGDDDELYTQGPALEMPSKEIEEQLSKARVLESQGKLASALWEYGTLIESIPQHSPFAVEVDIAMTMVQSNLDREETAPITMTQTIKNQLNPSSKTAKYSMYQLSWFITLVVSVLIVLFAVLIYIFKAI